MFSRICHMFLLPCSQRSYLHTSTKCNKAQIIDGKFIANTILEELKDEVKAWVALGHRVPTLTAILVGNDSASSTYVNNKMKSAAKVGKNTLYPLGKKIPNDLFPDSLLLHNSNVAQLSQCNINQCNIRQQEHLQLIREHMVERAVCNAVAPHKDVDGFNIVNVGRFCLDLKTLIPCTPLGVQELIRRYKVETFGKNAVVCGRSKNVGMPIAMLLHADGAEQSHMKIDSGGNRTLKVPAQCDSAHLCG
ncbi:bifunctional methylenetetrahydrofolate dehydrogenase/cyclohydrolase, mitochondrial [Diaphorina citri]|uniref:Bifunctional methylenetetrahydrofolate dehydrogenase/cyclohydrolase, mitochondrial n=1 Tax=Diaphorina citri TaxID=121845 RepID=A0A3Q0JCM8_DIACI|nr:bifunctional methylenetetrahydrofolate dehydrogenase/cyclohydrolase, mitochondrial [Diaphorina citri]